MKERTPAIDVIVPVYNAESYLCKCVDSLLAQDHDSYTVTLVDDGSTDGSGALCDRYAAQRPDRVRVLHQRNAGPSAARNNAVARSQAAYICFVDADDRVSERYLSALIRAAEEFDAPMAVSRLCREFPLADGGVRQVMAQAMERSVMDRDTALAEACYERRFGCFACGRLVRRELAAAYPFPEGRIFEDSFAIWRQFMACDRVAYTPEAVYYYLQRAESLQHRSFEPRHLDLLDAAGEMMDMFRAADMPPAVMAAGAYKVCRASYVTAFHGTDLPFDQYKAVYAKARPPLARYRPALKGAALSMKERALFWLLLTSGTLFYALVRLTRRAGPAAASDQGGRA